LAVAYSNISGQYIILKQFAEATEYSNKALLNNEKSGDKRGKATIYQQLQLINTNQGLHDEALRYSLLALDLTRQVDNSTLLANALRSIGNVHLNRKEYPQALTYVEEACAVYKNIENMRMFAQTTFDIGRIHAENGAYDRALAAANDALNLARAQEDHELVVACENLSAESLLGLKRPQEALERLLTCTRLMETHRVPRADLPIVYQNLATAYTRLKQKDKAAEAQAIYNELVPPAKKN